MHKLKTTPNAHRAAKLSTRQMVLAALFAAMLAVFSQIAIPMVPVPMNLALLAVFLGALVLEPRWALISVGLYLVMGVLGLPVFSGFRGGPSVLFGPTGGYLLGYLFAAAVISLLKPHTDLYIKRTMVLVAALFACYLLGTLWLMMLTGRQLDETLPFAVYPFLLGDTIKIMIAAFIAPRMVQTLKRIY